MILKKLYFHKPNKITMYVQNNQLVMMYQDMPFIYKNWWKYSRFEIT